MNDKQKAIAKIAIRLKTYVITSILSPILFSILSSIAFPIANLSDSNSGDTYPFSPIFWLAAN